MSLLWFDPPQNSIDQEPQFLSLSLFPPPNLLLLLIMASASHLPSSFTNMKNHITTFSSESFNPKSHPFGQVSLPKKNEYLSPSGKSSISALGIISTTTPIPGVANYNTTATITTTTTTTTTTSTTRQHTRVRPSSTSSSLVNCWREVQGCNNWENLLDPLHPLLRQEIIRYGEFVTASYKAFDLDPNSKRYLNCKYGKKSMLREVGMENCGYEVTKYIYATPDINININPMINNNNSHSSSGFYLFLDKQKIY